MDAAMASNLQSAPESQAQQAKATLPSCNLCRKRKIKCDRIDPCSNCQRSSMKCVFAAPSRLPRGRQGGRRKADSELLQRISKLESLVKNLEGDGSSPTSKTDSQTSSSDLGMQQQRKLPDSTRAKKSPGSEAGSSLDQPFLRTISDEISGLRYVLGSGQSDDEDDEAESEDEGQEAHDDGLSQHSRFAICGPGWLADQVGVSNHPTPEQVFVLCEAYMVNVHTVSKILHGPSLRAYLHRTTKDLNCSPGPRGLEALHFSVFHAAVTSLTETECSEKLKEEKLVLIQRYRLATELALAEADFINTTELSTLQALVLFLNAVRSYDQSRFSWTLISLSVRIAQALGLHRENNHTSFPLFQREMRRRLWWQICVLDASLAQDRGTDPAIVSGSYNTRTPLHINDEDICLGGPEEVQDRQSFTDMTFCSIVYEIYETVKQLNYVPPNESGDLAGPSDMLTQRINLVLACQKRIEHTYLRHLDLSIPFHFGTKMVADCIRANLWLFVYRPLQQRPGFGLEMQHPNVLHLSTEIMEKSRMMLHHPAAASFSWLASSYVQWHALAITLAELCVQTEGSLVERAWTCVDEMYRVVERDIAGSNRGMLWRPVKKLYTKAQKARQAHLRELSLATKTFPDFSQMDINSSGISKSVPAPVNFSNVSADVVNPAEVPLDWLNVPDNAGTFNWDPWLSQAPDLQPGDMNQNAAWNNWENFVMDFQTGESAQGQFGLYTFDAPG